MSSSELNQVKRHPIQPLEDDGKGVLRFRSNGCVQHLVKMVKALGGDWVDVMYADGVTEADRVQFSQLSGYSLGGFSELSHVKQIDIDAAEEMHKTGKTELQARHDVLERKLNEVKNLMRPAVVEMFDVSTEFDEW